MTDGPKLTIAVIGTAGRGADGERLTVAGWQGVLAGVRARNADEDFPTI